MESVASTLKSERIKRNLSLSQIAEETRISQRHLQSLEEGRYDDLPGGMYNRAFLRAYCEKLNLDARDIIRRYEEEVTPRADKIAKAKVYIPQESRSIKISPIAIWSLMLLISAGGLFFSRKWITAVFSPYFSRMQSANMRLESHSAHVTKPSARTPLSLTSSPDDKPNMEDDSVEGSTQVTVISGSGNLSPIGSDSAPSLRLEIAATQECWISIEHDGNLAIRKLLEPGEVQSINAADSLVIRVGNAGGVNLKINGKPAKPLGKAGEVIDLTINKNNLPDFLDKTAG